MRSRLDAANGKFRSKLRDIVEINREGGIRTCRSTIGYAVCIFGVQPAIVRFRNVAASAGSTFKAPFRKGRFNVSAISSPSIAALATSYWLRRA